MLTYYYLKEEFLMRSNSTEYDYDGWPIPEGHHLATEVTIGTIIFDDLLNEDEIISKKGRFNPTGLGECKIEVYSGEGDIPHFHLFKEDNSFACCICIYSSHFFPHGGKYRSKLNSKQCKQLDDWLDSPTKIDNRITNWGLIKIMWEIMNPQCKFPESKKVVKKPYYRNMIDFKEK
jgi:hypothetical protein